jgi:hypothetical protein
MQNLPLLNKIEHHLLSMQVDDSEPLFILYADTKRDIKGTTLDIILTALIRLIYLGFSDCLQEKEGKWQICENITLNDLKKRFEGQSDDEQLKYPIHINEYYFKITQKGEEEENRDIYDSYYSN